MKSFLKLLALILIILLSIPTNSKSQDQKWKGNLKVKNGVTYINNPEKPVYFKKKLPFPKLTEIMSIGVEEGDEQYMLGSIFGIAFDKLENIYLLDNPYHCIKVYDKNGKYLKQIGRQGQGPGEFNKPSRISITSDDRIVVFDLGNRRICILNKQGDFEHSFISPFLPALFHINKKDEIIFVRSISDLAFKLNKGKYDPYLHLDLKGNELRSYGETHFNEMGGYKSSSLTYAKILQSGNLLTAHVNFYRVIEYNPFGKLVRVINKKDQLVSEKAIIKPDNLGSRKSVRTRATIDNLYIFPDGSFLIKIKDFGKDWKIKKALPFGSDVDGIVRRLDYFNKHGQFLASYSWDYENYGGLFHIDKKGFVYTRKDAFGIPKLTKYKIEMDLN